MPQTRNKTMTEEEVMNIDGMDNPVLLADGMFGMLVIRPVHKGDLCGIQVFGEEDHRWINPAELVENENGSLQQSDKPINPQQDNISLIQALLAMSNSSSR
jgi:hypothetical protein